MACGDFFDLVPKDFRANLEFRVTLREQCASDLKVRRAVWEMCKRDPLFWMQAFCFLYEPRPRFDAFGNPLPKTIPMIFWDHQVPATTTIYENLGINDIAVYKSRGEGISWIAVLLAIHDWLFDDMAKIGLVSSTELKADDPGNMDSLGCKIDWELQRLPTWMAGVKDVDWKRQLSDHSWVNYRNGSQINAFAATAETGRAGRYKWFLADELAFWDAGKDRRFMEGVRESTECRLAVSTPNGSEGAFYDMVHVPSNVVRIRVHWTQNSYKNRGMYKFVDGRPEAVDPRNNPIPPEYIGPREEVQDLFSRLRTKGFRLEGRLRSPWYDRQCDRADATPQSIAQELDLDFSGSMYRVFPPDRMDKMEETVMPPIMQGSMDYHPETLAAEFMRRWEGGECKLWVELDAMGRPPVSSYVVAADISSGLGGSYTSNSVCEVIDRATGEQVLEYVCNTMEPSDFAELCVSIAKWFYDAYLGWEVNGPGGGFTSRVMKLGYPNVYMRTIHWKRTKRKQKQVGWNTDEKSKELMFSEFLRTLTNGEVIVRSEDLKRECGEYVRTGPKSAIVHAGAVRTEDDSSRSAAHGDRVIAFCVAIQLMQDRPLLQKADRQQEQHGPPRPDTLAWRVQQWERDDKPADDWEDGTLADAAGWGLQSRFTD